MYDSLNQSLQSSHSRNFQLYENTFSDSLKWIFPLSHSQRQLKWIVLIVPAHVQGEMRGFSISSSWFKHILQALSALSESFDSAFDQLSESIQAIWSSSDWNPSFYKLSFVSFVCVHQWNTHGELSGIIDEQRSHFEVSRASGISSFEFIHVTLNRTHPNLTTSSF